MADSFPELLESLFVVPEGVDAQLKPAVAALADTLKADLVISAAPPEVVMLAAAAVSQFAKHFHAQRRPYADGGYGDAGSERAAMSSLNNTLTSLRDAMSKLRVSRANPAALAEAVAERDQKLIRCVSVLLAEATKVDTPLCGDDLQFWVQSTLWPKLQDEGLVE